MQKGNILIFLLIGIVVLAAVGGAFYLGRSTTLKPSPSPVTISQAPQPTIAPQPSSAPDETVNWKKTTFNGLGLKVPPGYYSGYLNYPAYEFAIASQPIPSEPQYDYFPAFYLKIIKNKTLKELRKDFGTEDIQEMVVDGKPALKTQLLAYSEQYGENRQSYDLYIEVGLDLYHFGSTDINISQADQQKYFDQILSTFKFTQ